MEFFKLYQDPGQYELSNFRLAFGNADFIADHQNFRTVFLAKLIYVTSTPNIFVNLNFSFSQTLLISDKAIFDTKLLR